MLKKHRNERMNERRKVVREDGNKQAQIVRNWIGKRISELKKDKHKVHIGVLHKALQYVYDDKLP